MIVEGTGKVAPAAIPLKVDKSIIRFFLEESKKRCEFRKYENGSTQWQRGLIRREAEVLGRLISPSEFPILAGFLGEYAVSQLINHRLGRNECEVDLSLKPRGDGGIDLVANGLTIDVKTSTSKCREKFLLRRLREDKSVVRWECDVFVFCEWRFDEKVMVRGWFFRHHLERMTVVPGKRGKHFNVEPLLNDANHFGSLIDEIRSREQWH